MTRAVDRPEFPRTPTNSPHPRTATDTTTARRARFAALGSRNFRLFLLGQVVVTTGLWVQRIAQDWLVLDLTGSATAVGVTTALQWAPMLVFGLLGGQIADRYPRRHVLQATQIAAALLATILAGLTLTHHVTAWHVQLLAAALGTIAAIEKPVRSAFATDLVGPGQIHSAVSLSFSAFYLGSFAGPALSGVLITTVGPGWAFAVNAVSFAAPLIALTRIDATQLPPPAAQGSAVGAATVAPGGVRAMLRRPQIWRPMALASVFVVFTLNLPVTLATYARTAEAGPAGYALLTSTLALGSVIGALLGAGRARATVRELTWTGFVLAGIYLLAAAMPTSWGLACTLLAIGIVGTQLFASANAAVQLAAGPAHRGRVMAVYLMMDTGGAALGGPLLGAINEHYGPRTALVLAGVIPAVALVLLSLTHLARPTTAGTR